MNRRTVLLIMLLAAMGAIPVAIAPLHADPVNPPRIEVEPREFEIESVPGDIGYHSITIWNENDFALDFTVDIEIIAEPEAYLQDRRRGPVRDGTFERFADRVRLVRPVPEFVQLHREHRIPPSGKLSHDVDGARPCRA